MRIFLATSAAALLLSLDVVAARPATAPATLPADRAAKLDAVISPADTLFDSQRRNVRVQRDVCDAMPVVATYRLEEVVKLTLVDGFLRADFDGATLVGGQNRFAVEGTTSTWISRAVTNGEASQGQFNNVSRFDFDETAEGQIWQATLTCSESLLVISAAGIGSSVRYQQSNGTVTVNALRFENGRYRSVLHLTAPSLPRLRVEHPAEVREYLKPLLLRWTRADLLSPGAADVYAVFGELPARPDAARQITALLPRLDAESFAEREAASLELAKLDRAGVQAAMRLGRIGLSLEQNNRLDAFVASARRRVVDDPAALRRDPTFLVECLEDEDPAVRAAAKSAMEVVFGRAIEFDPDANIAQRAAAVEALRVKIINGI